MKNILAFLIIGLGLIIFSCSDNSSVNSPPQSESTDQLNRSGEIQFYVSEIIDGTLGGEISIDTAMINAQGDLVRVQARLKIDKLSFEGVREIRMIPNFNDVSIQFFPQMSFNKQVKLNLVYSGNNLEKLGFTENCIVGFVFIGNQGEIEPVGNDFCIINWPQQSIRVANAKLLHFSRYGFIR